MKLLTIGYGGRLPEEFARLLVQHGVRTIADIRILPKGYISAFTKTPSSGTGIEKLLGGVGIKYAWVRELGNPFREDEDWRARYREMLAREGEPRTKQLLTLEGPVCLLCAEKLPQDCHRSLLVEWLAPRGHEFEHIV